MWLWKQSEKRDTFISLCIFNRSFYTVRYCSMEYTYIDMKYIVKRQQKLILYCDICNSAWKPKIGMYLQSIEQPYFVEWMCCNNWFIWYVQWRFSLPRTWNGMFFGWWTDFSAGIQHTAGFAKYSKNEKLYNLHCGIFILPTELHELYLFLYFFPHVSCRWQNCCIGFAIHNPPNCWQSEKNQPPFEITISILKFYLQKFL